MAQPMKNTRFLLPASATEGPGYDVCVDCWKKEIGPDGPYDPVSRVTHSTPPPAYVCLLRLFVLLFLYSLVIGHGARAGWVAPGKHPKGI